MKITWFYLGILLLLTGCSDYKIVITSEYIINPNWDEQANSIKINKMKIKKDSTINPFSDLSQEEILNKLEEDSLFRWFANAKIKQGNSYKTTKIYFNRDNGFTWLDDISGKRANVFGDLEKGNWYKFSHLVTYPYYVYVFVDSIKNIHRFDVNLANY
jgi:hypothetical protein